MSRNLFRSFSRLAVSFLAVLGSLALLVSPEVVMADNAAPAAAPQTTAPAAPAAPAKKPVAMKKKTAVKKNMPRRRLTRDRPLKAESWPLTFPPLRPLSSCPGVLARKRERSCLAET